MPVPTTAEALCEPTVSCRPASRLPGDPIPQDETPNVRTEDDLVIQQFTLNPGQARIDTPDGSYFTWHNRSAAVPGRPIQPQVAKDIALEGTPHARGAVLLSADYEAITDWDPLIARPVTDTRLLEPDYIQPGWWPTQFFAVNTLKTKDGWWEQAVVTPGQFSLPGTQRKYNKLEFDIYHSNSEDRQWPTIWLTDALVEGAGIDFAVDTEDPSGIRRVLVTYTDGAGQWSSLELTLDPGDGLYHGRLDAADPAAIRYFVQSVDNAGNVAVYTNKDDFFAARRMYSVFLPLLSRNAGVTYAAAITDVALQHDRFAVYFETSGYEPRLPGQHVHFFFDTVPPEQAGVPGAGPWYAYGGPSPFTGYGLADRPPGATRMCVLVANPDHSVQLGTGNCFALPVPPDSARITGITLGCCNRYLVQFETVGFEPVMPGQHVHFFFDTVPPEQAGVPGAGPWYAYGGPSPFTGYGAADRPAGARQMCILVANPDHSVRQDTGNCYDLP